MSSASPAFDERFVDLAIQRATIGLSQPEQLEFEDLVHSPENQFEAECYDLTAAALDLSFAGRKRDSMPREVQDQLLLAAGKFFGTDQPLPAAVVQHGAPVEVSTRRAVNRFSRREAIALTVTAACLMLMLSGWNPLGSKLQTASERMQQFTSSPPADLVEVNWIPNEAPNARGKVVWSNSRQEGYMEFAGMPENDPSQTQYQLWIFDTDKNQKFPVDGGVFDIDSAETVVVPIKANIPVSKAVQFAVTLEKPGGVVVSEREHIPVLAVLDQ